MTEESNNYVVYVHTTPTGYQYFGMSKNIKNRWQPARYKDTSLAPYIEQFGWKNITHQVVASGLSKDKALKLEGELIMKARESGTAINAYRSGNFQQTDEYREECKAYRKAYYEAHPEEKAYAKAYYEAHPEECKARHKDWYEEHKEEQNARSKAWNEEHPEEKKAIQKRYYEKNKGKIKARKREQRKRKKGGNKGRNKGLF